MFSVTFDIAGCCVWLSSIALWLRKNPLFVHHGGHAYATTYTCYLLPIQFIILLLAHTIYYKCNTSSSFHCSPSALLRPDLGWRLQPLVRLPRTRRHPRGNALRVPVPRHPGWNGHGHREPRHAPGECSIQVLGFQHKYCMLHHISGLRRCTAISFVDYTRTLILAHTHTHTHTRMAIQLQQGHLHTRIFTFNFNLRYRCTTRSPRTCSSSSKTRCCAVALTPRSACSLVRRMRKRSWKQQRRAAWRQLVSASMNRSAHACGSWEKISVLHCTTIPPLRLLRICEFRPSAFLSAQPLHYFA